MTTSSSLPAIVGLALICGCATSATSMYRGMNDASDKQALAPPVVTPQDVAGMRVYIDPHPTAPIADFPSSEFAALLRPELAQALAARGLVVVDRPDGAVSARVALLRADSMVGRPAPDHVLVTVCLGVGNGGTCATWHHGYGDPLAHHAGDVARSLVSVMFGTAAMRDVLIAYRTLPQPASADDKDIAKAMYKQANDLRDAGNMVAALPRYKAAFEQAHTPVLAVALARAYAATGQPYEAFLVARDVPSIPIKDNESELTKQARRDAAMLAGTALAQAGTLVIGWTQRPKLVVVDSEPFPRDTFDRPFTQTLRLVCTMSLCRVLVDPGPHVIAYERADGTHGQLEVTATAGTSTQLRLP